MIRRDSPRADDRAPQTRASPPRETAQFHETSSELAAHQIVEYRIASAVQIKHDPAEIEQAEKRVVIDRGYLFGGRDHDVEDEETVGRQAHEEAYDYGQQHVHHLSPGTAVIRVAGGVAGRVANKVAHDERV